MLAHFTARSITGSGRGKTLGTPTINMDLADIPTDIQEGIYAGWVTLDGAKHMAAIHYGPRPVFKDIPSFEAYLLDTTIRTLPVTLDITLEAYLRPVMDFPTAEALMKQIEEDISQTRALLTGK